ncbi:hypothetical protein SULI_09905 [Saccharolobus solfataricus]|nr:hypothetical protein [Saccharolobus solfataricus]AKA74186.1 hypothetical protein SULB_1970 [Saccharolobus solfataricus]AKA76885.1 hypothetical protein SULC_1968 [Saccharolobus solfataricus]AKA79577.1 hypothetical protein SULA_1969 [Saccharolobus solfataricus]AZF68666.1 hypothetical protein SULG_09905 [Saccharolobus solfataricus]AZF71286.1 hypothetical protein SULH_09905 [Saccharolobus solfataricus]
MPYVDVSSKICRPNEAREIKEGDIILVYPATLNVNGKIVTFPPLSLVSDQCTHEIKKLSWIEGIILTREVFHNTAFLKCENYIEGEIEILEPTLLTAFTFKQAVGRKIKGYISKGIKGVPLLKVNDQPIVSIDKGRVNVGLCFLDNRDVLVRLFGYSIFYYITSTLSI